MSFSTDVKNEIIVSLKEGADKYIFFYGMLLFCRHFSEEKITFRTEHKASAELFAEFLANAGIVCERAAVSGKDDTQLCRIAVPDVADRKRLIEMYDISPEPSSRRIRDDIINEENISAFLGGAFLSCGSMTEPMKEYHLEFAACSRESAYGLAELLNSAGIKAKIAERKKEFVVYMKESGSIEDILTMMGAAGSSIELMNIEILKDIRNKTNRITNCDNANIERTLKASMRQIEDIEYIQKTKGLDFLPPELRNTAEVRLDNPEISLKDLGELLDKPLGRSGVNHRLAKISEIAEQLREEH